MVYLSWRLGKPPCTVHIFIPTILLLALFRKEERAFFAQKQELRSFSAQTMLGTRVAQQYALSGQHLFLHRLSGAHEPRRRFALSGQHFSAPAERGTRTALAWSPLTGGEFSAEVQRGDSPSADGGSVAAPAAGAKRKGHLRFPFLFELLPFPCFLIWRRFPICDRFETEYGSRVTAAFVSQHIRSSQTAYCYTYGQLYAGCGTR